KKGAINMIRFDTKSRLIVFLLAGLIVTACSTYYEVKDPSTGNTYYTEKIKRDGSAARFEDTRTNQEVTIQNSEIREIDKSQYDAGRVASVKKSNPPPKPAEAPAPSSESVPNSSPESGSAATP